MNGPNGLPTAWASPAPQSPHGISLDSLMKGPVDSRGALLSSAGQARIGCRRLNVGRLLDAGLQHGASPSGSAPFSLEQFLQSPGGLPSGLAAEERDGERLCGGLQKDDYSRLAARGAKGQKLRREALRGKRLVVFTAGYEGKRFVYERAKELGVRLVIIESPHSWSRQLLDEGVIESFVPVDMSLASEVLYPIVLDLIRGMGPVDGIATVVELSIAMAARLAEDLGLPGPMPEAVDQARDKQRTRACLEAAGLPTPRYCRISGVEDLDRAMAVGFPAVLKPLSGAASLGVMKVENAEALRETYLKMVAELRDLVVLSGALVKNDGKPGAVQAEGVIGTTFLLEQYLDGPEVDIDLVMSDGQWQYAGITDNGPTLEPYFNETWAVVPSLLPLEQQRALRSLAVESVKALGFFDGVFHVELRYSPSGPQLIEVNARMGGGPVHKLNMESWGVDLVEETLFIALGIPSRPVVAQKPINCIASSQVNALRSGILVDHSFLDVLRDFSSVISVKTYVPVGEKVVGPDTGLPTWLAEVIVAEPTSQGALDLLLEIEDQIQEKVRIA